MDVVWLTPLAFAGLAALALPVAIHLLVRHKSREVPFPSLRFLVASRLSAVKRRNIQDAPLLAVRLAIVACATAAAAGPLLVTPSRRQAWEARIARAIVVVGTPEMPLDEERRAFRVREFAGTTRPGDLMNAAAEWLAQQPPAAREVVVVGELRRGSITRRDLEGIPAGVGVRFLPNDRIVNAGATRWPRLDGAGSIDVTLEPAATRVAYGDRRSRAATEPGPAPSIEVDAPDATLDVVRRALEDVLAEGPIVPPVTAARVRIAWTSGQPEARAELPAGWMRAAAARLPAALHVEADDGRLVVTVEGPPAPAAARDTIRAVITAVFREGDLTTLESAPIDAASLASWSRAPGPVPETAPREDEGDRRWLWAAALALLGLEWWKRRPGREHA